MGEGHDLPARTLAEQLREERPDVEVAIEDCLPAMGRVVAFASEGAARVVFYRSEWVWDLGFWLFTIPPTRALTQRLLTRLGAPGLLRLIQQHDPDVIVSVYPNVTEVLGRLKRAGRVRVPVVAAITDLAAMHYWASRGVDVHLVTHPESIEEVRTIVGADAPVHCVHGLTAAEFRVPRSEAAARRTLHLPATGRSFSCQAAAGVSATSGARSNRRSRSRRLRRSSASAAETRSCGRSFDAQFDGDLRVRVEGFTDVMPEWLAAGDVLVHSTGGLTVLEALMRGCPAISYGWGRGHVRVNNAAFRRFGLADVAETPAELRTAIVRALERGRTVTGAFDGLPSAASFVLAAADAR